MYTYGDIWLFNPTIKVFPNSSQSFLDSIKKNLNSWGRSDSFFLEQKCRDTEDWPFLIWFESYFVTYIYKGKFVRFKHDFQYPGQVLRNLVILPTYQVNVYIMALVGAGMLRNFKSSVPGINKEGVNSI